MTGAATDQPGEPAARIRALLARRAGRVHMLGIGGVGMAGIAFHLSRLGFEVSGCDASRGRTADWLERAGIRVAAGHDAAHLAGADWVIYTPAVDPHGAEMRAAARLPAFRRGHVLPVLLESWRSVVVAGSHGKTTTSSFIAQMLAAAGQPPSFCIGGEVEPLGGVAGAGSTDVFVAEGDESDGTLARYAAAIAVVTNIEFDHMEHFANAEAFESCFARFIGRARRVLYCADDPRAARLAGAAAHAVGYGLAERASLRATACEAGRDRIAYTLQRDGRELGRIALPVPGPHNILNSLAAAGAGFELGLSFAQIRDALAGVALPRRRFDRIVVREDVMVVSDYAHHPSEVRALLRAAAAQGRRRLLGVFQPHRYTRTLALGADFGSAFDGLDELVLLPVYAASEQPLEGGTSFDLYGHLRRAAPMPVTLAGSMEEAWAYLRRRLAPGDLVLIIGAGDVERIAGWARRDLAAGPLEPAGAAEVLAGAGLASSRVRLSEPLAGKTTFGVGGAADAWVDVGSEDDLSRLAAGCGAKGVPLAVFGGGSNVLISDLGFRGVACRLSGAAFRAVRREGTTLVAGAGAPMARVLAAAEAHGLGGLEFMEGIPGTVGGSIRMNAGAWGGEICPRLAWLRGVDATGRPRRLEAGALRYSYRDCPSAAGLIVVEAAFALAPSTPADVAAARAGFRSRRAWMRGLRCAGSVFRNPPGNYAGRLIEAAGFKGAQIGGAEVSRLHANIITAAPGARASDVLALAGLIAERIRLRDGIALQPEVVTVDRLALRENAADEAAP